MHEKLYTKCPVCSDGDIDRRECMVCEGHGFIESGLHTGQVETFRRELRDCYRMIDECVSLSDVMRNGLSEDLLNRARLEAKYNHSFPDLDEDDIVPATMEEVEQIEQDYQQDTKNGKQVHTCNQCGADGTEGFFEMFDDWYCSDLCYIRAND